VTQVEIPDYEPDFVQAVQQFWGIRRSQADRQAAKGTVDAGTRGAVTGGRHLDPVADLVARAMADAGMEPPSPVHLPGYYRRSKNWDLVARYGDAIAAVVELKSQVGSIGNNANNRIEEMIGQAVDLWKASREDLLGGTAPWFGYLMLIEDSEVSRRVSTRSRLPADFPGDPEFEGTSYIDRYRIALGRLRLERDMDQVCLVAASPDGNVWYPDPSMSFQNFATALHARGMTLRSQLGEAGA